MIELRPYQSEMVEAARSAFAEGTMKLLLTAPTGAGKTVMFSHMVRGAQQRGKRACILVHRDELLEQVSSTLTNLNVPHATISKGKPMTYAPIQVASVFTLARRLANAPEFDFLIVDECHHVARGNTWTRVLERYPAAHVMGVTATPVRLDGRGLGHAFERLVQGPSTAALTKQGWLVPARVLAPPDQINVEGIKTLRGDFDRPQLAGRARTITGNVVGHYMKHCDGKRAVAFCVSLEHAAATAQAFNCIGINAETLDGGLKDTERQTRIARFRSGKTLILATCDLISEGFDLPAIEVAILLRPTQSLGLYLQQVGRALRPLDGKSEAIILDHAGNCFRHGLPTQEHQWELTNDKKKPKSSIALRTCAACYAVAVKQARVCPVCGQPFSETKRPKPRHVSARDGELIEISELATMPYKEAIRWARSEDRLRQVAVAKGYSKHWIRNVMKARGAMR